MWFAVSLPAWPVDPRERLVCGDGDRRLAVEVAYHQTRRGASRFRSGGPSPGRCDGPRMAGRYGVGSRLCQRIRSCLDLTQQRGEMKEPVLGLCDSSMDRHPDPSRGLSVRLGIGRGYGDLWVPWGEMQTNRPVGDQSLRSTVENANTWSRLLKNPVPQMESGGPSERYPLGVVCSLLPLPHTAMPLLLVQPVSRLMHEDFTHLHRGQVTPVTKCLGWWWWCDPSPFPIPHPHLQILSDPRPGGFPDGR